MIRHKLPLALVSLLAAGSGSAAVPSTEAAKLGVSLTPLGAEKSGNASGSIPAWTGGITQPPQQYLGPGHHHVDPYADDRPLFTITRESMDGYRDNLTAGQIALLETYPETYSIPVYQSRRSASLPRWVYENTKRNATTAILGEDGSDLQGAYGGTPFPIPSSGLEAIWNHLTRYRGTYVVRRYSAAAVHPNGKYSVSTSEYEALFRFYDPNGSEESLDNKFVFFLTSTIRPARLAGRAMLVHESINQLKEPRQSWAYSAGQRRVRRAPSIAYDTPVDASDGIRTVDDADMFNGATDRFTWKLLGKKEIFIPYNNYMISNSGVMYADILDDHHLSPGLTRHELHRVWVVEATLKNSTRHIYSKRVFYIDEDSWNIAVADQYDSQGMLWRVSMAYLKNFYELPATAAAAEANYDLRARRYYVTLLDSEEGTVADYAKPIPKASYFSPSSLRARGVR